MVAADGPPTSRSANDASAASYHAAQVSRMSSSVAFGLPEASAAVLSRASAVRRATVAQYAKIADPIDPNESVSFVLFGPASDGKEGQAAGSHSASQLYPVPIAALQTFSLTKNTASAIQAEVQANVKAYGGVQGRMHSLFLGAQPAYFNLRELATGALVKCFYKSEIYPSIASALQRQDAVLHVYGWTKTDLVERKLEEIDVMRVDVASVVTDAEFDSMFGSISGFTGKLTTQEFIDKARGRGN